MYEHLKVQITLSQLSCVAFLEVLFEICQSIGYS